MRNDVIEIGGARVGVMDAIAAHLVNSPEGNSTDLYGYALHVEVTGTREGLGWRHIVTHTHPASDGSVPGWEKLRAYTRNVGIPLAIGAHMLARGDVARTGVITPEEAFKPHAVFAELARRGIIMHQEIVATTTEPQSRQPVTA